MFGLKVIKAMNEDATKEQEQTTFNDLRLARRDRNQAQAKLSNEFDSFLETPTTGRLTALLSAAQEYLTANKRCNEVRNDYRKN